jgi:hypothetical protein
MMSCPRLDADLQSTGFGGSGGRANCRVARGGHVAVRAGGCYTLSVTTDLMRGFGYKTGWLAVRRGDVQRVAAVLGGRITGLVAWEEGIAASYREPSMLAVTPPLRGADDTDWLLVTGGWIASEAERLDVGALSIELDDEVQLFASHRVVEWHRWDRGRAGVTVRSFEYVGETGRVRRWVGTAEAVERSFGLPANFDVTSDDLIDFYGEDDDMIDEEDVMRVAAAWSLDPTSLEGQPANGQLTLIRVPPGSDPLSIPDGGAVINITDIIAAGLPHDEAMRRFADLLREHNPAGSSPARRRRFGWGRRRFR